MIQTSCPLNWDFCQKFFYWTQKGFSSVGQSMVQITPRLWVWSPCGQFTWELDDDWCMILVGCFQIRISCDCDCVISELWSFILFAFWHCMCQAHWEPLRRWGWWREGRECRWGAEGRAAVLQQSKGWHREVWEGKMRFKADFYKNGDLSRIGRNGRTSRTEGGFQP